MTARRDWAPASGARSMICGSPPTAPPTRPMPRSGSRDFILRMTPRSMPRCRASRTTCSTSAPISARPVKGKGPGGARLTVTANQVAWLESEIDRLNAELSPLRSFVLPGGSEAAAYLHLARTICRRAERLIAELKDEPGESVTRRGAANTSTACPIIFSLQAVTPMARARETCSGSLARTAERR